MLYYRVHGGEVLDDMGKQTEVVCKDRKIPPGYTCSINRKNGGIIIKK